MDSEFNNYLLCVTPEEWRVNYCTPPPPLPTSHPSPCHPLSPQMLQGTERKTLGVGTCMKCTSILSESSEVIHLFPSCCRKTRFKRLFKNISCALSFNQSQNKEKLLEQEKSLKHTKSNNKGSARG